MEEKQKKTNTMLAALLAVTLIGAMITLVVVLSSASSTGREAIEAYLSSIRSGASVAQSIAGDEAESLTKELRQSKSFSISNFQSQADTSCFWVTLQGEKKVEARFVLAEKDGQTIVTAASLLRECDCPIDFDLACRLE